MMVSSRNCLIVCATYQMKQNKIFGHKDKFAIEIKYTSEPRLFFLRFWLHNLAMGDF